MVLKRLSRRVLVPLSLIALGAAGPLAVVASHQFSDVPTSSTYHADIDAIRDAGVTTGCAAGLYCPKDFVTREQMAAFLNRLGALQAGKTPVVNADKVDGKDEVLGVGTVVIRQGGTWVLNATAGARMDYNLGTTRILADEFQVVYIRMAIQEPGIIDGQAYGFKSIQVCWHGTVNASVAETLVFQNNAPAPGYIVQDVEDRPMLLPDCYTVTDPTPNAAVGATRLSLHLEFSDNGYADMGDVVTTWVPIP